MPSSLRRVGAAVASSWASSWASRASDGLAHAARGAGHHSRTFAQDVHPVIPAATAVLPRVTHEVLSATLDLGPRRLAAHVYPVRQPTSGGVPERLGQWEACGRSRRVPGGRLTRGPGPRLEGRWPYDID